MVVEHPYGSLAFIERRFHLHGRKLPLTLDYAVGLSPVTASVVQQNLAPQLFKKRIGLLRGTEFDAARLRQDTVDQVGDMRRRTSPDYASLRVRGQTKGQIDCLKALRRSM
jgi:hypothetical protein